MKVTANVRKLKPYVPGEQPSGKDVIKLNTNENPYPPSPACAEVLKNFNLDRLRKYPDPVFMELRERIATVCKTKPSHVFVGNGSDEILALAARAFVEDDECIASLDPSYSLYKTVAAIRGVEWIGTEPEDLPMVKNGNKVSMYILTNPNAPTGTLTPRRRVEGIAMKVPGILLVDEAYADFASENCMDLATMRKNENVIVMRTLSKSFSLAGLRVGYCVGPEKLIEALYKVKDSYNVDAIAQSVALAALNDLPWMRANVERVIATRARITRELESRGWDILPSQANFIFASPPSGNAQRVFNALRKVNIFVRYFPGLQTGNRIRITIGTDRQMDVLLATLDKMK